MKIGSLLSLITFAVVALVLVAVVLAMPWLGDEIGSPLAAGLIAAFGGAACVGAIHRIATKRLIETELLGFRDRLDAADAHAAPRPHRCRAWMRPIVEAADRALDLARQRVEALKIRRRELEIQLRLAQAERQHMESILQCINDGVLVTDAFNELTVANDAACRTLQIPRADFRHQPIERVLRDPALVKLIKDTREAGNPLNRRHIEHRIGRGGRTQIYDLTLACVPNAQQEVAGVVAILRDITRERQIAEMQSDFVSGVSHELRTPLSSIKAYIEMLVDGEVADDKTRNEFYNIIQSETNRLSRLIDNILNISRIESGIVRVQREQVPLGQAIRAAVEIMQPQARGRQVGLVELPAPDCVLLADKDMIHQALLNLISNAIKYTPPGGRVTVESALDDQRRLALISVIDTGVGIPPDAQPFLFDKFFRVADHKKLAKGTGLGLNLVKHIVETVHHGRITVDSQPGRGSRFTMALPLNAESPPETTTTATAAAQHRSLA